MRVLVDLTRCQSYGQCVFMAPQVFSFHGQEALEFDYAPHDSLREDVLSARAACPVNAIIVQLEELDPARTAETDEVVG